MLSKKLAAIDKTRCVACGVCENSCPIGAVKVRRGCYAAVEAERRSQGRIGFPRNSMV